MNGKRAVKRNESGRACGHGHCSKRWCTRTTRRRIRRAIRLGVEA